MLDTFLISASLANLMLIWDWLSAFDSPSLIDNSHTVSVNGCIALCIVFAGYFLVFYLLFRKIRREPYTLSKFLLLIPLGLLSFSFFSIRSFYSLGSKYPSLFSAPHILGYWGVLNPIKYILLLFFFAFIYWKHFLVAKKLFRWGLMVVSPFMLLTFGRLFYTQLQSVREDKEPSSFSQNATNTKKTLWLVFDAFDYNYTFKIKETEHVFPEISRFKDSSFSFSHAIAPTPRTLYSMSSYLFGNTATTIAISSKVPPQMKFTDQKISIPFSSLPNLFKTAKSLELSTAIIGWYVPYCRFFEKETDYCLWFSNLQWPYQGAISKNIADVFRHTLRRDIDLPVMRRRLHDLTLEKTLFLIENKLPNLTLIHFPVPHEPGIYEPEKQGLKSSGKEVINDYYENLRLVDHALKQIRELLEKKNAWYDTNIIVTSDHWLRYAPKEYKEKYGGDLYEIPLMVKLAGKNSPFEYSKPVPTLPIATLLLGTLDGSVSDESGLLKWADANAVTDRQSLIDKANLATKEIGWED